MTSPSKLSRRIATVDGFPLTRACQHTPPLIINASRGTQNSAAVAGSSKDSAIILDGSVRAHGERGIPIKPCEDLWLHAIVRAAIIPERGRQHRQQRHEQDRHHHDSPGVHG
jgi:hypothetical protein